MAAMGYSQMIPLALKELMKDQSYGLLMNYIEFCYVQYGIGVPFSKKNIISRMAIMFLVHI